MTLDDRIQGLRLRVRPRAQALGSVSAACREAGLSRTRFSRWRRRVERYGPEGRHPRRRQARPGRPSQVSPEPERHVVAWALAWPTWGGGRLAARLAQEGRAPLAPGTGQRILRRAGLATRRVRLLGLEHHTARTVGLLTERTRQALWRARYGATRPGTATRPGELVCLDACSVGHRKGVGKVWQLTACDAACSYGVARLVTALTATATAAFLREGLVPLYQRAGWRRDRGLTDGGGECKAEVDQACVALGIRHTRPKPRHAWTTGFVERLPQTILTEHWRGQFRRRYFTRLAQLERPLQAVLRFSRFSTEERPHQGYRLRGRTPASVFWPLRHSQA